MNEKVLSQETMVTLLSILTLCGFSEKEAKLYLISLSSGPLSATKLVVKGGYKKGNTYALLHGLQKRGLVTLFEKDKKTFVRPESPQKILNLLEQKKNQTQQASAYFEQVLPQLITEYKSSVGKPVVSYFEGEEGVRKVLKSIYSSFNKVVYGCIDPKYVKKEIWHDVIKKIMPIRIKNKVLALTYNPDTKEVRELKKNDSKHLRKIYLIDPKKYPMPAEIDIWDDKVSFMSFRSDNFIGMIIENQDFATTLSSIFKLGFDLLEPNVHREKNLEKVSQDLL